MSPEQLAGRHAKILRDHLRRLGDDFTGALPAALDALAAVAEEHARDVGVIAVKPADDGQPGEPAPRRRAPARGRAK